MMNNPTMSIDPGDKDLADKEPRDQDPRDEEAVMREVSNLEGNPAIQTVPQLRGDPLTMNDLTMSTNRKMKGNVRPHPRRPAEAERCPKESEKLT